MFGRRECCLDTVEFEGSQRAIAATLWGGLLVAILTDADAVGPCYHRNRCVMRLRFLPQNEVRDVGVHGNPQTSGSCRSVPGDGCGNLLSSADARIFEPSRRHALVINVA